MRNPTDEQRTTLKSDALDITVELKNEHRQRVLTVTVTMEILRVDPEPQPPRT